jgi:GNAT superfamily N-acetyltransferase
MRAPAEQLTRLRAIHRKMSFETFERTVPIRPGWKREYYGGKAHVRPSWTTVTYRLVIALRPAPAIKGLRPVRSEDEPALYDAFLDAFRVAPEYADYPMAKYRTQARKYVAGYFADVRGNPSPASRVVLRRGVVLAAALVKERDGKCPLLDCVFTRPGSSRRGLATAVTAAAVNDLSARGYNELRSSALLANEPSLAWHARFGFEELPDSFVAQARCFSAKYELARLKRLGRLTAEAEMRLAATMEHWWAEVQRIDKLPVAERHAILDDYPL